MKLPRQTSVVTGRSFLFYFLSGILSSNSFILPDPRPTNIQLMSAFHYSRYAHHVILFSFTPGT